MLKRGITLGELIVAALTIVTIVISSYIRIEVSLEQQRQRIDVLEREQSNTRHQFETIDQKIDLLGEKLSEIKVELVNKENRK
jgi:hypothetical protein